MFLGSIGHCSAQKVAVKTNLFYGIYSNSPNLGVEFGLSPRSTVEPVSYTHLTLPTIA